MMNVKPNIQDDQSLDGRFYYSVEEEVRKLLIFHVMGSSVMFFEFWKSEDNNQILYEFSFQHGALNSTPGLEQEIRNSEFLQDQQVINSIQNFITNDQINQTFKNFIDSKI